MKYWQHFETKVKQKVFQVSGQVVFSKYPREAVKDRETCHAAVQGVAKNRTRLSVWTQKKHPYTDFQAIIHPVSHPLPPINPNIEMTDFPPFWWAFKDKDL